MGVWEIERRHYEALAVAFTAETGQEAPSVCWMVDSDTLDEADWDERYNKARLDGERELMERWYRWLSGRQLAEATEMIANFHLLNRGSLTTSSNVTRRYCQLVEMSLTVFRLNTEDWEHMPDDVEWEQHPSGFWTCDWQTPTGLDCGAHHDNPKRKSKPLSDEKRTERVRQLKRELEALLIDAPPDLDSATREG